MVAFLLPLRCRPAPLHPLLSPCSQARRSSNVQQHLLVASGHAQPVMVFPRKSIKTAGAHKWNLSPMTTSAHNTLSAPSTRVAFMCQCHNRPCTCTLASCIGG
jgi:hypothetical protein